MICVYICIHISIVYLLYSLAISDEKIFEEPLNAAITRIRFADFNDSHLIGFCFSF